MSRYLFFITRRERIVTPLWILSIFSSLLMFALLYPTLIPTTEEALALARTMQNPAMVAMMEPIYGIDAISQAIVMSQETLLWYLIAVAVMNIFLVTRHTRTDEELGRVGCSLPDRSLRKLRRSPRFFALIVNIIIALLGTADCYRQSWELPSVARLPSSGDGVVVLLCSPYPAASPSCSPPRPGSSFVGLSFLGGSYILRAFGDLRENSLSLYSLRSGAESPGVLHNDLWPIGIIFLRRWL